MRQFWTASILLSTALSTSAATLGRHSGAVVVGRPLDAQVQVLLAPGEDLANLCMAADVFYGDTRLPAGLVDITPISGSAEPMVRIRSRQPVNEPFVTLTVKVGCSAGFSRRYTMLSDMVSEPVLAATPAPVPPTQPAVSTAVPASADRSSTAPPAAAGQSAPSRPKGPAPSAQSAAKEARTPASAVRSTSRRAPNSTPPSNAPQLKLEPLDVAIDRDPILRLSSEITSVQAEGDEARAQARALWQAINASPEEVLRGAQALGALDAEVKQLREDQAVAQARQADLVKELKEAQKARYQNPLVFGLVGALAAALLGIWYVRRRTSAEGVSKNWWSTGDAALRGPRTSTWGKLVAEPTPPKDRTETGPATSADAEEAFHASATRKVIAPVQSTSAPFERRDFAPSALGTSRSVATEELFDIQQQADFFVSLGEDEQAIRVLRNHLQESYEPSAMAYLDLFKLYHKLNRRDDYESLRDEFNRVFNAGAPPFERYADQGRGLEAYETAFSRIQALWPQPRVLDLIERSIFRDDQDERTEVFDLEAYRELLLLHAMAKDIIHRGTAPGKPEIQEGFQHTAMQPLKLGSTPQLAGAGDLDPKVPPASTSLGLDIDLDALDQVPDFQPSMPVISPPEQVVKSAPVAGVHAVEPPASMSNWIDFEVVDFELPDSKTPDGKPNKIDPKA